MSVAIKLHSLVMGRTKLEQGRWRSPMRVERILHPDDIDKVAEKGDSLLFLFLAGLTFGMPPEAEERLTLPKCHRNDFLGLWAGTEIIVLASKFKRPDYFGEQLGTTSR